jgi:hypothetical protein
MLVDSSIPLFTEDAEFDMQFIAVVHSVYKPALAALIDISYPGSTILGNDATSVTRIF